MKRMLAVATCLALSACARPSASPMADGPNASGVIPLSKAAVEKTDWGRAIKAFTGETYGVKDLLTVYVELKPGQWPHPPHVHAEEEFVVLVDGAGTWYLNGKEIPAKKGDVAYIGPWDSHSFRASKDAPATFFVVKYGYKGLETPKKPGAE